jgi:hypothetical protein
MTTVVELELEVTNIRTTETTNADGERIGWSIHLVSRYSDGTFAAVADIETEELAEASQFTLGSRWRLTTV